MAEQLVLLGSSTQTPIENKTRREVVLPGQPSIDFILTARCRIVSVGGRISMTASDLPGDAGGAFTWSTTSKKIRLVNASGPTLVIEGLSIPSDSRDDESITVARTGSDGAVSIKTVSITVAKVTFVQSTAQKYGFDDFDTPNDKDDHISVEASNETYLTVKIEGGALGTDFDFVCDDPMVCTIDPPPKAASFDLRIRGGLWKKAQTQLAAKVKCPASAVFAQLDVHVYSQRLVKVLVAKVVDANSPGTRLNFATADYALHQQVANDKLKEAVVRFEMRNFDANNGVTDVPFDTSKTGSLAFDINANGGPDFNLIKNIVTTNDDEEYRVVIVRNLHSYYFLDQPAKKGDTSISVRGATVYMAKMPLGKGPNMETVDVTRTRANVAHLAAPLTFDHAVGEPLEFPAAAWSVDPIVIAEGNAPLDEAKWTILHEVGHSALNLLDIVDRTDFMHFEQGNTDHRLRYCPRVCHYDPTTKENQWETIPRPVPKPKSK